ncbi:MAG: hypothetical protein VW771_08960, partial [Gammaproteobacteria bacterium]
MAALLFAVGYFTPGEIRRIVLRVKVEVNELEFKSLAACQPCPKCGALLSGHVCRVTQRHRLAQYGLGHDFIAV